MIYKKLFIFIVLLINVNLYSQKMKVTQVSEDIFEINITNPDNLWFFMPTENEKLPYYSLNNTQSSQYELGYELTDKEGSQVCVIVESYRSSPISVFDVGFSGQFNREENITYTYQLGNNISCEDKLSEIYIRFVLVQKSIDKIKDLKRWRKFLNKEKVFNGELYSNKIPLKLRE